jgi:hypothetical protein
MFVQTEDNIKRISPTFSIHNLIAIALRIFCYPNKRAEERATV